MTASDGHPDVFTAEVPGRRPLDRVLVLIPTYNERENLPRVVRKVRETVPSADVLVLDDASPDGTGEVADRLAERDAQVTVMHRAGKEGLGAAYLAGFAEGLERGYDLLVEMDADGSHPADALVPMLAAARSADLVIGSRWVPGGSVVNWPRRREALSRAGNLYIRLLLGMPVKDATAGYRVYRTSALRAIGLDDVVSAGYCFQADLTWRVARSGLSIVEVPIRFVEREIGDSKMDQAVVTESFRRISEWGLAYRGKQLRGLLRRRAR